MDRTAAGRADIDATGHEQTQVVHRRFGIRSPRRGQDPREVQRRRSSSSPPPPSTSSSRCSTRWRRVFCRPAKLLRPSARSCRSTPTPTWRLGRVVEVNAEENTVVYEASGTRHTLGYRSLIAATGATQVVLRS